MKTCFSLKANLYDKYRWNYPDEAIGFITKTCKLGNKSVIADFGAGTGILTKHFEDVVNKIYAIEPDNNMASILESKRIRNTQIIRKCSHEVNEININEVDAILAGHALHWFNYEKTISVFREIISNDGFLISINNSYSNNNNKALEEISKCVMKYINDEINILKNANTDVYFRPNTIQIIEIPFKQIQTFEELINGLSSASYYPDSNDGKKYNNFKRDAGKTFNNIQENGVIVFDCVCTVRIGKLN